MRRCVRLIIAALAGAVLLGGCAAPTATLDLISVARKGIAIARTDAQTRRVDAASRMASQVAALDAAFDADVRLAEAGSLTDDEGESVELTAEWVISARKGYSAARASLEERIRSVSDAHMAAIDNLDACDEALAMASQMIVANWNVSQHIKQYILEIQEIKTDE